MKLRALIADDEPLARERLKLLLSDDAEVEVAGECRTGQEVVAALRDQPIDVLFLDIQMPATGGFEVIEEIGPSLMPVTVFVSAHNNYALRAFEVHALDYLTKPVEPERLHTTLARVKERIASKVALATHEQMKAVLDALKSGSPPEKSIAKRLLVHNGAKNVLIAVADIAWIEAADYYSCLHVGTKNYMLREPIKQLAVTLDPAKFVRVHRSAIVNLDHVREIVRDGQGEGSITMNNGHRLKMSKAGWQNLLAASRG
jgi:two-component system, LytTR family, response regulator